MMLTEFRRSALAALLAAAATGAVAQDLPEGVIDASFRPGWRLADGGQMAALDLRLAPGWKTYWRAPGEAGIPPHFDWTGSRNIGEIAFHWPVPQIFDLNGLRTIGYHDELVLPIEIRPADPKSRVHVSARIDLGICKDICVPVSLTVSADLASGAAPDPAIDAALKHQPTSAAAGGVTAARCSAEPIRDGLRLTSQLTLPALGPEEFAVVELADPSVWVSAPEITRRGGELSATADLVPPAAKPFTLDRSTVRITVFGGDGRAVEIRGCTG